MSPLEELIESLRCLPGVGPKSASRLAFFLLRAPEDISQQLADALIALKQNTAFCPDCFNIMLAGCERCEICESRARDESVICVVEEPLDVLALERIGAYKGKYHVLHGVLSPIEGIGPDDLKIKPLLMRAAEQGVAYGVLGGTGAAYVQRRFDATSPIEIDVRRLRALPQAGCGRLEVTTRQRAVLVAGQRQDQELVYQLSYCVDRRFPEER